MSDTTVKYPAIQVPTQVKAPTPTPVAKPTEVPPLKKSLVQMYALRYHKTNRTFWGDMRMERATYNDGSVAIMGLAVVLTLAFYVALLVVLH